MDYFVHDLLGHKLLEHVPYIALMFSHGNGLSIKPYIFIGDRYGRGNRLEQIFIIRSENPVNLVHNFNDPNYLAL